MAAYRHISHGFDPIFNEHSRILVLGSFPSAMSRKEGFYYGNPRNRFWKVMAACAGTSSPETVADKIEFLLIHGIALTDVIKECDIKGSADSSIKNVIPARIIPIIEHAEIKQVVCNGATAGRLYRRYQQWETKLDAEVLPSTSPANAAWSLEGLCDRWKAVCAGHLRRALPYAGL